jgi:Outer membrane lipoprotein
MNIRFLSLGLVVLLGISACAETRRPAVSPAPIPAVQRDAFEEGMKAYRSRDYGTAVLKFQAVIGRFPGSPLLEEAQWMIGKSYEADGASERALNEYRSFLSNFPASSHRYEAMLRIDFLEGVRRERTVRRSFAPHVGILLNGDPRTAMAGWEKAPPVDSMDGIRTVVLRGYGTNGVFFRTDEALVMDESISGAVRAAHARGFKVWVTLPARHLPWFKVPADERDLRYDSVQKRMAPTAALDLFNPTTLNRLERFFLDFAATGADGIVVDEDPWIDTWEGFSPAAQSGFLQDFGEPLRPDRLISLPAGSRTTDLRPESVGTPLFWRWAGWKNREVFKRFEEVIKRVRAGYPGLDWVCIVSADSVMRPNIALARSGVDLLEAKQHGFDYFGTALPLHSKQDDPLTLLNRLVDLIGDSKRVIALVPRAEERWIASHRNDFQAVGVLFTEAGNEPNAPLTRRRQ